MSSLTLHAPAKINLSLEVLHRREDGFHELRSLMAKVALADSLRFSKAPLGVLKVTCSDARLSCGEDNLVTKAARLMQAAAGQALGAKIHIKKNIPISAGLAGGSADAAAALHGLNAIWQLGFSEKRLKAMAMKLGSDVAFCLSSGLAHVCKGRGEKLGPALELPPFWVLIVKPPVAVPTAWVYGQLRLVPKAKPVNHTQALIKALKGGPLTQLNAHCVNDLEAVTISRHSVIAKIKSLMMEKQALVAKMSGSGPSVWGFFASVNDAKKAQKSIKTKNCFKKVCKLGI
jgi:4-diphosphocytidyl-2-C-methyl-D-erythritol kinase